MDPNGFDMMTRLLAPASRRKALPLLASIVGVARGPLASRSVLALSKRARRQCRNMDGKPLEKGTCSCGWHCGPDRDLFSCHGNPACVCYKDASGRGFCGQTSGNGSCTSNAECDPDRKCAVNTCAGGLCILPCPT
jgi:hypothetical protein